MSKNMSFRERAKILFTAHNVKIDSEGKEILLSSAEEDLIVSDMQSDRQIDALNRVTELYNMALLAMGDVQMSTVQYKLKSAYIDILVLTIRAFGDREEDLELSKKMRDVCDLIEPSDAKRGEGEPNIVMQSLWIQLLWAVKKIKKVLYSVEYINELAEMDLVGDSDRPLMDKAKECLEEFKELRGLLSILKLFRMYRESKIVRSKNYHEPEFIDLLDDHVKVMELTEEDRVEVRNKVNKVRKR